MRIFLWCLLVFFSMSSSFAFELNSPVSSRILVSSDLQISQSPNKTESPFNLDFKENKFESINLGYTNDYIWIKAKLVNSTSEAQRLIFYLDTSLAGRVELFEKVSDDLVSLGVSGSTIAYNDRSVPATVAAFSIELSPNTTHEFYLKRKGRHRLDGRAFIVDPDTFQKLEMDKKLILVFYTGAFLAMLLYNLFVAFFTKSKSYYIYAGFIFFMGGVVHIISGGLDFYFSNLASPSNYLLIFSSGSIVFGIAFTRRYLSTDKYFPKFIPFQNGLMIIGAAHFFIYPFLGPESAANLGHSIDLTILVGVIFMFGQGIVSLRKNVLFAKFYVLSWGILLTSALCWFAMTYKVLPQHYFTKYALLWGNLLEMLILSLGLAFRIVVLDQQKKDALAQAREKEKFRMLLRVVMHDIANPLTIISGYASRLFKKLAKDPKSDIKLKVHAEKIVFAAEMIENIIHSIKQQEVKDDKELAKQWNSVSLRKIILKSTAILETKLDEKELTLDVFSDDFKVMADETLLLNNVITNILTNAIKFSHRKGKIEISAFVEGDWVKLEIRDFGVGISQDKINEFQMLGSIQSSPGTEGEAGTGNGIILVKNYIELFGGRMLIENFGGGTLVSLYLKNAS